MVGQGQRHTYIHAVGSSSTQSETEKGRSHTRGAWHNSKTGNSIISHTVPAVVIIPLLFSFQTYLSRRLLADAFGADALPIVVHLIHAHDADLKATAMQQIVHGNLLRAQEIAGALYLHQAERGAQCGRVTPH